MRSIYFFIVDENKKIACKKFTEKEIQYIIFIDVETDGLIFSFTIQKSFSKKNIINFLKSKFSKCTEKQ